METLLYALNPARRTAVKLLAALAGIGALLLAGPAVSHAEEINPNDYSCIGHIGRGHPEAGSEEQQVGYSFYCNGPITGYQLQSQIPLTGIAGQPTLTSNATGKTLTEVFECSGEVPGYALNCVGSAKAGYETFSGQFAIGTKLCVEPREDPLLTVTYAYLEKGVVMQAISGPFDLGRPLGCKPDAESGGDRLNPKPPKKHKKKHSAKKSSSSSRS
jgi:hypothetical protein